MYEEEKKAYVENNGFVNMSVPTEWGKHFRGRDQQEYVSVAIPIKQDAGDVYCSFIVREEQFKKSTKEAGMSYFGFPKTKKDTAEDYLVSMKYSKKMDDGSYADHYMDVTSQQLREYVDAAVERNRVKSLFINAEISDKLIRNFTSNADKALSAVSVPVYSTEQSQNADFYEIVVPSERLHKSQRDGFSTLSLFRNGPDGKEYNFTAKRSEKNPETGNYDEVTLRMTSAEVIHRFELSAQRYRENHPDSKNDTRTVADELGESHPSFNQMFPQAAHRHHGR
jgi:hypothetical protein